MSNSLSEDLLVINMRSSIKTNLSMRNNFDDNNRSTVTEDQQTFTYRHKYESCII